MTRSSLTLLLAIGMTAVLASCKNDGKGNTDTADQGDSGDSGDSGGDADNDGYTVEQGDCDDNDANVHPNATEICDGIDNDCDAEIDEDVQTSYYADTDSDGFGDPGTTRDACEPPTDFVPTGGDCDDTDATVHPSATELCDGVDNNCDGDIDEGLDSATWYADSDSDGYGDPDNTATSCEQPTGYVDNDMDCDDSDWAEPVHVSQSGPVTATRGGSPDTFDSGGIDSAGVHWASPAGSADNPFETIQEGIDAANVCVHVYPGTYEEDIDFNGKDILVMGVEGAGSTTIQGTGSAPVVTFNSGEGSGATLMGFAITGGGGKSTSESVDYLCDCSTTCTKVETTYLGGGIYVDSASPTLMDLLVNSNKLPEYSYTAVSSTEFDYVYSFGGGMYVTNGSPVLQAVTFKENYADAGGGAYSDDGSNVSLTWVVFDENSAAAGGGMSSEGLATLYNSIAANNKSSASAQSMGGAGFDVPGGTFTAYNIATAGNDGIASLYIGASGSATIANVIFTDNEGGYVVDGESGASLSITYSDVYNSSGDNYGGAFTDATGSDGNIASDPVFVAWSDDDNFANDDLHLQSASPGVDAGTTSTSMYDVDGTRNDMGAYGGPLGDW